MWDSSGKLSGCHYASTPRSWNPGFLVLGICQGEAICTYGKADTITEPHVVLAGKNNICQLSKPKENSFWKVNLQIISIFGSEDAGLLHCNNFVPPPALINIRKSSLPNRVLADEGDFVNLQARRQNFRLNRQLAQRFNTLFTEIRFYTR